MPSTVNGLCGAPVDDDPAPAMLPVHQRGCNGDARARPLRENDMKSITVTIFPALAMSALLAGCMVPAQNRAAAAPASQAPLTTAEWAKVIEIDRASVRAGQLPNEVITYDLQIEKMIPESQAILAAHDEARARIWSTKMHALIEARDRVTEKFAAKAMARNNAVANALGNGKPDPCLSPMGKNTCAAPSARQGDSAHYTVGPGGLGATIGNYTVGPGGIGAGGF